MSLTILIAKRLEQHAGKQGGAGSIPGGGIYFHSEFSLIFRYSQLGEAYKNEIKHNIHPE